ncbi:amidase [Halorubellus sp. JP-L1]|uniref:amidase n=1 Tax=Halorubellus sp. JP-L1 TaxID=2715753 RepID=UPI00140C8229|nr:amidase [Halorubellus sp. JP-L1]NHN41850.1 amidase [Halorubellus sp. JP-L1]
MPYVPNARFRPPSAQTVRELAEQYYLDLSEEEVEAFVDLITGQVEAFERLRSLHEPERTLTRTVRESHGPPSIDADPDNAIVTECLVEGADDGPLAGYEVAVKDNIAVAGIEMTAGSNVFEGYIPKYDASAVERLLDAGADIVAKANMSDMAVSGSADLSATGPIYNPRDNNYLAGGSSGGSAVAVINGNADIALGTDQAGSIRVPAAFCGCVGHKPTHGLVPYTGAIPMGFSFDHLGPMTNTVEDAALMLDTIAGPDGLDPRQDGREPDEYAATLGTTPDDITVGVLEEGFIGVEEELDDQVKNALEAFEAEGAEVRDASVPLHDDGALIWRGVVPESIAALTRDDGVGHFVAGHYDTAFQQAFATARRGRGDEFPATYKFLLVMGEYLMEEYYGYYHAISRNLTRKLSRQYDDALSDVDVLALPTSPITAFEADRDIEGPKDLVLKAQTGTRTHNTSPFDVTGHPSISVPAGTADGLPVGLLFVAPHYDDVTALRAAHAFEQHVNVGL